DPRRRVFRRLFLTLIAGGALFAVLGLVQEALGNGDILWISGEPAASGRASGPFINPNHFAAWLEMVIPAGLAYLVAVVGRVRRGGGGGRGAGGAGGGGGGRGGRGGGGGGGAGGGRGGGGGGGAGGRGGRRGGRRQGGEVQKPARRVGPPKGQAKCSTVVEFW